MVGKDGLAVSPVRASGGVEPPSVSGHLGGGEPIVKPTFSGRFIFLKRVIER